ncbi:hypothetical protein QC763_0071940 [Podospora pseudopauciseta]|uniref:Nephrocystin 3-like N-terminal domain-containing protein n=1 Tax=Podospora pseudopauciseta TaxID=2093780 RepID=A0ABR0HE43_9PEZI|nr:hypothetical protein QC763_0071940 [Podospora pseudopauciseta]
MVAMLTGLKCLMEQVEQTDPWFSAVKGLDVKGGVFNLLREEMEELMLRLEVEREGGLKGKLTWKLNKKEMDGLMNRIERWKGVVSVALLGDHSKLLSAISTDLVCVKEDVDGIKERINNLKVDMTNVKDGVKGLTDSAASQRSGKLSSDVFVLLLSITEWCPGIPGAGKTTLASLLISFLETSTSGTNKPIPYLYCNYKERSQQSVQNMMGSLLKQLIQHTGVIDEDILKFSKDEKPVRL